MHDPRGLCGVGDRHPAARVFAGLLSLSTGQALPTVALSPSWSANRASRPSTPHAKFAKPESVAREPSSSGQCSSPSGYVGVDVGNSNRGTIIAPPEEVPFYEVAANTNRQDGISGAVRELRRANARRTHPRNQTTFAPSRPAVLVRPVNKKLRNFGRPGTG
jgi:hypothetical protein